MTPEERLREKALKHYEESMTKRKKDLGEWTERYEEEGTKSSEHTI